MDEPILVGDAGGTNIRFGIARRRPDGSLELDHFSKQRGADFDNFDGALTSYLRSVSKRPRKAFFAVAGIVENGQVEMTNRSWCVRSDDIKQRFNFDTVALMNDFAAMARAVPVLGFEAFEVIYPGLPIGEAPLLVAGAGTGLGVATLLPPNAACPHWAVISGEGGHAAYAPRTDLEFALAKALKTEFGYVSNELVCSGQGMERLHRTLCRLYDKPFTVLPPQTVLDQAAEGDQICLDICQIRARAIMQSAGDAVLLNGAWGGVVLAGGVTERLMPYLLEEASHLRFTDRGVKSKIMSRIPVYLMTQEKASLYGAAALSFDAEDVQKSAFKCARVT